MEQSRTTAEPREYDIVVDHLTKSYGQVVALNDVSLRVPRGEFFGFLGLNGAGKTTAIKVLSGLLNARYTRIAVAGHDLAREALKVKASVGVVLDQPALYDYLTGYEFLEFIGAMYGIGPNELRPRVMEMLELVNLVDEAGKVIIDYSRGMYQRLSLAAAMIHRPQVLFLDEPFIGIDALGVHRFKQMLHEYTAQGRTVFLSSHIMEMVEGLCTSFAIVHQGRIRHTGTMSELRRDHPERHLEELFVETVGEYHADLQAGDADPA